MIIITQKQNNLFLNIKVAIVQTSKTYRESHLYTMMILKERFSNLVTGLSQVLSGFRIS